MGFSKATTEQKRKRNKPRARNAGGYGFRKHKLKPKQIEWMQHYIETNSIKKSAELMNISVHTARGWSEHPVVVKALNKLKSQLKEKVGYSLEKVMEETEDAKKFAIQTKNANALVKAIELRAKINGLIIEKHDHRMAANFSIQVEGVRQPKDVGELQRQNNLHQDETPLLPSIRDQAARAAMEAAVESAEEEALEAEFSEDDDDGESPIELTDEDLGL